MAAMTNPYKADIRRAATVVGLIISIAATGGASLQAGGKDGLQQRFEFSEPQMGVLFTLLFYGQNQDAANLAAQRAFGEIKRLNDVFSDYDPQSELSRLSRSSPTEKPIPISGELWDVLSRSQELAVQSAGAFDVTVGPFVRLWRRARRQQQMPSTDQLDRAKESVGFKAMAFDPESRAVQLKKTAMRLDLGGIAKGFAIDAALTSLCKDGFPRALVDAGGDIAVGDPPPNHPGWRIGVVTVQPDGSPEHYITLSNCAAAASGDLFQFVEIDGQRFSHIVDPRTGFGLTSRANVTVFAPDCTTADSLATAVSVLGASRGAALLEEYPNTAAIVATIQNDQVTKAVLGEAARYRLGELEKIGDPMVPTCQTDSGTVQGER